MPGKPPRIDLPPRLPRLGNLPHIDVGKMSRLPRTEALREILDRYNPKILNRVMQGLKSLITLRPDRGFELAVKREQSTSPARQDAMVMKGGKMIAAGPEKVVPPWKMGEAQPVVVPKETGSAPAEKKEELSLFEKIFLARFEGGVELGEGLPPGQSRFLEKTEAAWMEFFQKFLPFTEEKRGKVTDLETLIYRGLLKRVGVRAEKGAEKGILISDLKFLGGKTDKFARLEIAGFKGSPISTIFEKLAEKVPGDALAQALLAEWIGGPEFAYQSLSHRIVNPEAMKAFQSSIAEAYRSPRETKEAALREAGREATRGIALSARTEQFVASQLDLDLGTSRVEKAQDPRSREAEGIRGEKGMPVGAGPLFRKKRKGLFGGLFGEGGETGPVFVPWFQQILRPKKIPGKVRWYVPLAYFVTISAAGLVAFYIFRFLLQR